jgi:phage antirepressor YoqD-like protein
MFEISKSTVTMSSREIAYLVGKRHDNVKRTIESMAHAGVISQPQIEDGEKSANGVIEKIYLVNKRSSLIVVAQLCPEFTARIVDRWQELEAAKPAALPSYSEALRQLADTLEQSQQQQALIERQAPKVQAFDRIANADGLIGLQAAGKILQQQPNKFIQWLRSEHWIYKRPGGTANLPYSDKANAGYMTTKAVIVQQPDGSERVREQAVFTPKGIEKIALMLGVHSVGEAA